MEEGAEMAEYSYTVPDEATKLDPPPKSKTKTNSWPT
jgi:hypothetical protein